MILGLLGNAGRWKRVKDTKMKDIESFTVNIYPSWIDITHSLFSRHPKLGFLSRKIPIFSTFFLRFLFYINFNLIRFNIVFYIVKNSQKNRTKMSEFRNSISILGPKIRKYQFLVRFF